MSDYYTRAPTAHIDGTPIFSSPADRAAEDRVITAVSAAFRCEVHSFGALAPIDCYAIRDGRMIGVLEIKARSHDHAAYPTTFLNIRKWLALSLANFGLNVPALYVVAWRDAVGWVNVADVDASQHRVSGATRPRLGGLVKRVERTVDTQPVIEVPVDVFKLLDERQEAAT